MRGDRPLDVMIVQRPLDWKLPLDLGERLRTAMTVCSLPHGAQALELIEAGAQPDIILVDRRTSGVDVAALRRVLALRTGGARIAISFIDDEPGLVHGAETRAPIALLHQRLPAHDRADRPHDD